MRRLSHFFQGHPIRVISDSTDITVIPPEWDFQTPYRSLSMPALPQGAEVTGATFSLFTVSGEGTVVSPGLILGVSPARLDLIGVNNLLDGGPCLPPSCAPTLLNISMDYDYGLAPQCLGWTDVCFQNPTGGLGTVDLLAMGLAPSYFANGFTVGTFDEPFDIFGCCHGFTDQILYPGFNSETDYYFHDIGPSFEEEISVTYVTTPEPSTWLYGLSAIGTLLVIKRKALRRRFQ